MKMLPLAALAALAVAGCKSPSDAITFSSTSVTGVQVNSTGVTLGHTQSDAVVVPALDKAGKPITVRNSCGEETSLAVYSSQTGNAVGSSAAGGTNASPPTSTKGGRVFGTGQAAVELTRANVAQAAGPGYDVERAASDCSKTAAALAQSPPVPSPGESPSTRPTQGVSVK